MRLFGGSGAVFLEKADTVQQSFLAASGKQRKAVTDPFSMKWKMLLLFPILVSPFETSHSNSFALLLAACPCREKQEQSPLMRQIYHWGNSADLITLATYLNHYVNFHLCPPQLKGKHLSTLIRTARNTKSKNQKNKKQTKMSRSSQHPTM